MLFPEFARRAHVVIAERLANRRRIKPAEQLDFTPSDLAENMEDFLHIQRAELVNDIVRALVNIFLRFKGFADFYGSHEREQFAGDERPKIDAVLLIRP